VSFGPGVGNLDKGVVPHLRGKQIVRYIPVDINYYLANIAAERVAGASKQVHVPFCIVGDFEDGMSQIAETIHDHTAPGRLFMMLGGTFGNLEMTEAAFLQGLYDCLGDEDVAILDIFIAAAGYEHSKDPLLPLEAQCEAVQRFLANGVASFSDDLDQESILADLSAHIGSRPLPSATASSIPNTRAFEFYCLSTGRTLIYVRRYNLNEFHSLLESLGFEVLAGRSAASGSEVVSRGVFFIRRAR
jgi:hypothetical protein